jgi:hypothetical protein
MTRKIDPALTRQAQAWISRIEKRAAKEGRGLTDWEKEFLESLDDRLEKFGSAFADPDKGQLSAPLSLMQGLKLREIGKKTKPKQKNGSDAPKSQSRPTSGMSTKLARAPRKGLERKSGLKRTALKRQLTGRRDRPFTHEPDGLLE